MIFKISVLFLIALSFALSAEASVDSLLNSKNTWTDENGKTLQLSEWKGKTLVLTMAYTACKKTCPLITYEKLKEIEKSFTEKNIKAEFIIATLDPANDTPEVLMRLKKKLKVSDSNWHFIRGTESGTREFAKDLGIADYWAMDDHIIHSFKIVYFDAAANSERALTYVQRNVSSLFDHK